MPIKTPAERLQDFEKFKPCSCRNVKDVCSQCPSLQEYKDWLLQQFTDLQTEKEEAVKQAVEAERERIVGALKILGATVHNGLVSAELFAEAVQTPTNKQNV